MTNSWNICIAQWVLIDGNYAGFDAGQVAEFALEFRLIDFAHSASLTKTAERLNQGHYRVNAEILYLDSEMWVLDFGVRAYDQRLNSPVPEEGPLRQHEFEKTLEVGQMLTAELMLDVDHFPYMEWLCSIVGAPPLIYTWHVDAIEAYCAPLIKNNERNLFEYDKSKEHWHPISHAGWPDKAPSYALQCTLLDRAPHADGKRLVDWDKA